jgi:hypothetical protein
MDSKIYHGQTKCMQLNCNNRAYFKSQGFYMCGVHSKRDTKRKELPKMSQKQKKQRTEEKLKVENEQIEGARKENLENGRKGRVIMSKLRMMRNPEDIPGFLKVFPNYKHQNRQDGFGCKSLSPMSLGPVEHGQPNLPNAMNIENFHQVSIFHRFPLLTRF